MRIFTPDAEAPFAGHPALGTAYIISHILEQDQTEQVILNLKAGQIPVIIGAEGLTMSQNDLSLEQYFQAELRGGHYTIEVSGRAHIVAEGNWL